MKITFFLLNLFFCIYCISNEITLVNGKNCPAIFSNFSTGYLKEDKNDVQYFRFDLNIIDEDLKEFTYAAILLSKEGFIKALIPQNIFIKSKIHKVLKFFEKLYNLQPVAEMEFEKEDKVIIIPYYFGSAKKIWYINGINQFLYSKGSIECIEIKEFGSLHPECLPRHENLSCTRCENISKELCLERGGIIYHYKCSCSYCHFNCYNKKEKDK